jgi:hypothetical protein
MSTTGGATSVEAFVISHKTVARARKVLIRKIRSGSLSLYIGKVDTSVYGVPQFGSENIH